MVSQQLLIQCDVCSVLFTYQTNHNILRTKRDMEKLSDGLPLSFQEFFQIIEFFHFIKNKMIKTSEIQYLLCTNLRIYAL